MAYSELIKNFNGIRSYLRSFYVFGFMHRDEFTQRYGSQRPQGFYDRGQQGCY